MASHDRDSASVTLDSLLAGAALVPHYDMARGLCFMTSFIRCALVSGDRDRLAVALGMLASLMSASRLTRRFARRLATEAEVKGRNSAEPALGAAALSFAGVARLFDGQLRLARSLGAEGTVALQAARPGHVYHRWGAQSIQVHALILMGRIGEAANVTAEIGREARNVGDELAVVAGESIVGYLLRDDIEGASALLAYKEEILQRVDKRGLLHQIVLIERTYWALYCERGRDALTMIPSQVTAAFVPFNTHALLANCALQVIAAGPLQATDRSRLLGIVRRARCSLVVSAERINAGMILQLDAALQLVRGHVAAAAAALEQSAQRYGAAEMALHEHMMQWRRGHLLGGDKGRSLIVRAEAYLKAQGIVNPKRWAEVIAAGLQGPVRGHGASPPP